MDWYFVIVMVILIGTMVMGATDPNGFRLELFYGGLIGAIIVIAYKTITNRRKEQAARRERRKSKKK